MELQVTKTDIARQKGAIRQKLNESRFSLELLIENDTRKALGHEETYGALEYFFIVREAVEEVMPEGFSPAEKGLFSTYVAAMAADSEFRYKPGSAPNIFKNTQINFARYSPLPRNDLIGMLATTIANQHHSYRPEDVANAFFAWAKNYSLRQISEKCPGIKEKITQKEIAILDKKYGINFTDFSAETTLGHEGNGYNGRASSIGSNVLKEFEEKGKASAKLGAKPEDAHKYVAGHDAIKEALEDEMFIRKDLEYFTDQNPEEGIVLAEKDLTENHLFVGPPGTGKTTLAASYAVRSGLSFLPVPCHRLASPYQFETSRNIAGLYEEAVALRQKEGTKGVIIFFDEIDYFLTRKTGGSNTDKNNVVSTFNTLLDGLETDPHIMTMGTTNRADLIEPAALRRFTIHHMDYPRTKQEIAEIHKAIMRKREDYAKACGSSQQIFEEFTPEDYDRIMEFGQENESYLSGAIIEKILVSAARKKAIACRKAGEPYKPVTMDDVVASYKAYNAGQPPAGNSEIVNERNMYRDMLVAIAEHPNAILQ